MKMGTVIGETAFMKIREKVQKAYDEDDVSGEFERRMKEDPDFAARHLDDQRVLKLLAKGFK